MFKYTNPSLQGEVFLNMNSSVFEYFKDCAWWREWHTNEVCLGELVLANWHELDSYWIALVMWSQDDFHWIEANQPTLQVTNRLSGDVKKPLGLSPCAWVVNLGGKGPTPTGQPCQIFSGWGWVSALARLPGATDRLGKNELHELNFLKDFPSNLSFFTPNVAPWTCKLEIT